MTICGGSVVGAGTIGMKTFYKRGMTMDNHLTWFFLLLGGVVGLSYLAVKLEEDQDHQCHE